MDEQLMSERFKQALRDHEDGTPQLFMYSLLDFSFEYGEEKEMVTVKAPISEIMYNPVGYIHGGIITYMADTAMGHLCAAFGDQPSVSLELKTQFFRTTKTGQLIAKAYYIKKGKQVQFVECTVEDDKERLLSKVTGTFYTV